MDDGELAFARSVLQGEARAVAGLVERVDASFSRAIDVLVACADAGGTVLVTGLGKSGLVGAKISATLASLGLPSHSVHPSEAAHGDLGRFRPTDCVLAISNSGETEEVVNLAAIVRQDGLPIISITNGSSRNRKGGGNGTAGVGTGASGSGRSTLEQIATVALTLGVTDEQGESGFLAPTNSTTATLALGDALALAAARRRNFTREDFAKRHPGGALGSLLRPVADAMRFSVANGLPLIPQHLSVAQALEQAASLARRPGAMMIVDSSGKLAGIFTDGDLRRLVLRDAKELSRPVAEVMTRTPRTLPDTALVRDAVLMVREFRQDEIPIVDSQGKPVGILDVQDLIALKLVKD